MQLYMIVKEKRMIDKQLDKEELGVQSTSMSDSRSFTDTSDYDESSSCITESYGDSSSRSVSRGRSDNATAALLHPNDMILEQSDEDDHEGAASESSSMERLPSRVIEIMGEPENMSLIEDDRVVADPITESYRSGKRGTERAPRTFFEESLLALN